MQRIFPFSQFSMVACSPSQCSVGTLCALLGCQFAKKLLVALLALTLVIELAVPAMAAGYKIAIVTGTTSQDEEEYRAAETLKAQYPDIVLTDTYPDNFSAETETTIGKLLKFANDPEVKAIIMVQAVQGATAAFTQIRNDLKRDDLLLIAGVPAEDPASITGAADIVLGVDEINGGDQIVETAKEWGVDVLIHYSFARHMSYETIVARLNIMKAAAEDAGIELVQRDAPDPTGDAGMVGAQNFILEDVPKVMQEYAGKKVAFFCTNCGMQEALQAAVLLQPNAYYPLPCCPAAPAPSMASPPPWAWRSIRLTTATPMPTSGRKPKS